ncbi:type-F conjugative transfer system pilin assembly protein TrbC [Aquabacterium sp. NJ1]|uniref:type-F conjugative transfer system pilin assembly protein TrbC n=1 Tax=Aquabacterium sp. NJ1 TaxID=1538295 RepID=UPI0006891E0A|nr:type-F conjugative transfer system pilin assembly protein TrbC [Aquabacterium sp. NJ1]
MSIKFEAACAAALLVSSHAWAQGAATLGEEWRMPSNTAIQAAPKPVMPNIDIAPQGAAGQKPRLDLEALAKQYQAMQKPKSPTQDQDARPRGLLAFISFSMPEDSIKRIVSQAQACGAVLVIRGFVDRSMQKTAAKVQQVLEEKKVAWIIDPKSFIAYQVTAVPTYVLTSPNGEKDASFSKQVGDVTIEDFLDAVRLQDKQMAPTAASYLRKIRG